MADYNADAHNDAAFEVIDECFTQHEKWGEQNHPLVRHPVNHVDYAKRADHYKQMNDAREKDGTLAWDGILIEEVFEALAEADYAKAREELVQVAAVAVSAIVSLDRQQSTAGLSDPVCPVTSEPCVEDCIGACQLEDAE